MTGFLVHPVVVVAFLVFLDQVTKHIIVSRFFLGEHVPVTPFFQIIYAVNTGVAFSMFQGANLFFAVLTALVVSGFSWWAYRHRAQVRGLYRGAAVLIVAGALGNLIDRVARGHVIDFLDVSIGTYHWPAFNVADSCITVGGVILFLLLLRTDAGKKGEAQQR
jgi:signal peptidase II